MKTARELYALIENEHQRSAWNKGVSAYALELLEELEPETEICGSPADEKLLLNGASDWNEYSYGGCSCIYDSDIAERLCTASELKRTHGGERQPNAQENWLDVQARALYQAYRRIVRFAR